MKILFFSDNEETRTQYARSIQDLTKGEIFFFDNLEEIHATLELKADVALIVVDGTLPYNSGALFYEYYKKNCTEIPLFYIATEVLIKQNSLRDFFSTNELNEHLLFPFFLENIRRACRRFCNAYRDKSIKESASSLVQGEFFPLTLKTLYLFNKVPCDIFASVGGNRYVRIIQKDQVFQEYILRKFRLNGPYVYAPLDGKIKLLEESLTAMEEKLQSPPDSPEANHRLLINSLSTLHDIFRTIGLSEKIEDLCLLLGENLKQFIKTLSMAQILNFTKNIQMEEEETLVAQQSILTLYYVYKLLVALNFQHELAFNKCLLGGFVCDYDSICLQTRNPSFLTSPLYECLEEKEKENYKSHPLKAHKLAGLFKKFPSESTFVALYHHETGNGFGFPNKLGMGKIPALSFIFNIPNQFVLEVSENLPLDNSSLKEIWNILEYRFSQADAVPILKAFAGLLKK